MLALLKRFILRNLTNDGSALGQPMNSPIALVQLGNISLLSGLHTHRHIEHPNPPNLDDTVIQRA